MLVNIVLVNVTFDNSSSKTTYLFKLMNIGQVFQLYILFQLFYFELLFIFSVCQFGLNSLQFVPNSIVFKYAEMCST